LSKRLFVVIVIYAYFIYILQGGVETHLQCGGMNKATLLQIVQECGEDMDKTKMPHFYEHLVYRI